MLVYPSGVAVSSSALRFLAAPPEGTPPRCVTVREASRTTGACRSYLAGAAGDLGVFQCRSRADEG